MKISVVAVIPLISVFIISSAAFAVTAAPKKCSASLIAVYSQKILDEALLKTGQSRRQILITSLIKLRDLCAVNDDGSELAEYFPEKIHDSVEISLDIENRFPAWDGGFAATAVADVRKLAKNYVQSAKPTSHCLADRTTTSGITALYADRFHEEFIGFLQESARVHILHPHLLRSSLSGAVIKVQVISNTNDDGDHAHEGRTGFISAADTDWNEDCL
ncbi:MAG: hypothetical protein K0R29_1463 [Pseudobdellovibrio sp.]|jgi:hypothetical protein|nr:hypothetical protein [Pseudobdellovibrio sp.]